MTLLTKGHICIKLDSPNPKYVAIKAENDNFPHLAIV